MKSSCLSHSNHAHTIQKILPIITTSFYEKYTEMCFFRKYCHETGIRSSRSPIFREAVYGLLLNCLTQ